MTVKDFAEKTGFEVVAIPSPDRCVDGVYIGDLLSWVMGKAKADNAWITIMSNINVLAVATLADISCIVLAEGVVLDVETLHAAESKGVNVLSTELSAYSAALKISEYV